LDREAGHDRRYKLKELDTVLRQTGWEVEKIKYINMPGIMGWIMAGYLGRFNKKTALNASSTNLLIKMYDRLFVFLSRITDTLFKKISGLSLFVVARKRN
jgi:hypothetical protein